MAQAPEADEVLRGLRQHWPTTGQRIFLTLLATALGCWIGIRGVQPVDPLPRDAQVFSSIRASTLTRQLLGDQPRPIGSPANDMAVKRLAQFLQRRGLEVEVSEAPIRVHGHDVVLRNVVARKRGTIEGAAVLLVAHHDSVAQSPGASDDGIGVAVVVEAAIALTSEPWKGRDIILLLTDGEEAGLLGAKYFADSHRWFKDVGMVLNIDNRGNSGPCLLYETGMHDARVMQWVAPALSDGVANSFFAEVSKHTPHGTDFAVFRDRELPGLNFALIGGHADYHQPTDTWDRVNLSSMQQQGNMVLAALYTLGMVGSDEFVESGRSVFLDVGGTVIAWCTARAGVVMAFGCAIGLPLLGWFMAPQRLARRKIMVYGFAATAVRLIVAMLVSWWLLRSMEWMGLFGPESLNDAVPQSSGHERFRLGYWPWSGPWLLGGVAVAAIATAWVSSKRLMRGDAMMMACGSWFCLALITFLFALAVPGVTAPLLPVIIVATMVAAICCFVLDSTARVSGVLFVTLPTCMAAITLTPLELLGWDAVGLSMPLFSAARFALFAAIVLAAVTVPRHASLTQPLHK